MRLMGFGFQRFFAELRKTRLLLLILLSAGSVPGELPLARLDEIFPPGGQAGATVEVAVSGADLDAVSELRFSNPGISGKRKLDESSGEPVEGRFIVSVPPETPLGNYDVRVVGRFGASNPRVFAVGGLPEILEKGSNKDPTEAQEIPLNTTLNGKADARSPDFFRFTAERGQRLLIGCESEALDSRMNPVLFLYTKDGREIERNRLGGIIDFNAPDQGEFLLKVHDFIYGGGEHYAYRLCISSAPRIDLVYPPVGRPGSKGAYVLFGRNLPGSQPSEFSINGRLLERLDVEIVLPEIVGNQKLDTTPMLSIPAAVPLEGIDYRHISEIGGAPDRVSNPFFIGLSADSVVLELEPNDAPESANAVSLPCEFVGRFYPAGDRDWISFEAKKGDVYWIEMISQRLGLPTNPFVLVQRSKTSKDGTVEFSDIKELYHADVNIGGREFDTRHRDPEWRFEVKEDGSYQIQVRDLFDHSQADAGLVYRLAMRKERPDFRLVAIPQAPDVPGKNEVYQWASSIRKGDRIPLKIVAFRQDGFNGEIELYAEGLPEGIACTRATLARNETSMTLMLSSSETASGWVGPLRIVGKARGEQSEIVREASGGGVVWGVGDYNQEEVVSRLSRAAVLAVSNDELAPIEIRVPEEKIWESWVGGKLEIPIGVVRRRGFDGEIKFKASSEGGFNRIKEFQVAANGTNAVVQVDVADLKLSAGTHRFYVSGEIKGKYQKASAAEIAALEAGVKAAETAHEELERLATRFTEEAKTAKDESVVAARAKSEETTAKKEKAAETLKKAKEALDRVKPTDTTMTAYSSVIRINVAKDPFQFVVGAMEGELGPGGETEIPVRIERLNGFDDPVTVTLSFSKEDQGLSATEASIPSGMSEVKIPIQASSKAVLGKRSLTLRISYKFKDKVVTLEQKIDVSVLASRKNAA